MPPIAQPPHVATHLSPVGSQIIPPVHVGVPPAQRSVVSSHVSAPLHAMPSLHTRAVPPQVVPVQTSAFVQNNPSSHVAPAFELNADLERAGSQISHWLDGLRWPEPKHVPPITQPVHVATHVSLATSQIIPVAHVESAAMQRFIVSSHISTPSHATPSLQCEPAPAHVPEWQTSPLVQNRPSSQLPPSFELNEVIERDTSHAMQGSRGETWPLP